MNWAQLLQQISQFLPRQTGQGFSLGGLTIPNQLAGAGLLGAGFLSDREPGTSLEARQSLRNLLTPESQTGQFGSYVKGLEGQFQPLLTQQRQRGIEDISQRFAAAFPKSVGAQGPEFGSLSRYITDEALPREQAFLGQLGLEGLDRQRLSASALLNADKPDAMSQLASILGYDLLTRGQRGQTGLGQSQLGMGTDGASLFGPSGQLLGMDATTLQALLTEGPSALIGKNATANPIVRALLGTDPASQVGTLTNLSQLFTGGQSLQQGLGLLPGATEGAFATLAPETGAAFTANISRLLGGQTIGAFEQIGNGAVQVLDQAGNVIGTVGANGQIVNGAGQAAGQVAGALSTAQVFAGLGGGVAGTQIGKAIADWYERKNVGQTSTAGGALRGGVTGAASGAAIGAIFGDGPGAVIGAILGGLGGGIFGAKAERRREDAQTEAETQATGAQRPAAMAGVQALAQGGQQFAAAFPAMREALTTRFQSLLNAGDSRAKALQQQALSLIQSGGAGISMQGVDTNQLPGGAAVWNAANPPAQALVKQLEVFATNVFHPGSTDYELLQSSETGKFGPGVEKLAKMTALAEQARALLQQMAS